MRPDGTPVIVEGFPVLVVRGETVSMEGLDMSILLRGFSEYTLLIAKRDPGAPIVWGAFATLIAGLAVTFYLPRRRIWSRLGPDGRLDLVGRSDRQVDFDREFGSLVDGIVAARAAPPRAAAPPPGAEPPPAGA
jgi:cytochrome c biogenesis protein ResB